MADRQIIVSSIRLQHLHEYNCWKGMRSRCCSQLNPSWKYYGEKGIKVCDRWQVSFVAFLEDMGPAPSLIHQIDRLRNEGDYEPSNCHWSTPTEQQANTSKITFLTYRGVTLCLHQWANIFGMPRETLKSRLNELGWSVDRAFQTAVQEKFRNKT